MVPERSWLSVEWEKPKRPSAVHGFLDQIAGRLMGDKGLRRSGEREWRKAAESRNARKYGSRGRSRHPSAPNGRSADGNIFSCFSGLLGGRKLIVTSTPPAQRGTTTRDRPSRSLTPRTHRDGSHRDGSHRERPVASRRRATDPSPRHHRHERR